MAVLIVLKVSVTLLIFGIGLESTPGDAARLFQQPRLMLRSLLAMYVLVPLAALVLVKTLPLGPGVEAGLLVLAVSAGAPLLPRKLLGIGDSAYVFSLVVISSVLAIVLVPVWLAVLEPVFPRLPHLAAGRVAVVLAESFFLPLAVGMAIRRLLPGIAKRASRIVTGAAGLALAGGAILLLASHWQLVLDAKWTGILALAVLIFLSLVIGHLMGGPLEDDRTALAVACATRHIGIAVVVATSVPGPRTSVILAVYILVSAAISLPYMRWRRAVAARRKSG